ncbi:uncharacterized protein LOC132301793 [Cornus florida]|uniref:uncharacterized protein LOC132301793 n=1 Tax=Cornus florida TaxID=4283 RepID=UPI0028A2ADA8|nr:uncharacterized protein LOC132301793 [Cornus florida]
MTLQDAQATPELVTGPLFVLDRNVTVLIDLGLTHSFVASSIIMHLGRPLSSLDSKLFISTPIGEVVVVVNEYRDCVLQLGDRQLKVNLISLGIPNFDIILGMNWLSVYHVSIDCFRKEVVFQIPGEPEFIFTRERNVIPNCLISAIQTNKLLKKGCQGYLAYVVDTKNKDVTFESVPVVREFTDVFPKELPGLPMDREAMTKHETIAKRQHGPQRHIRPRIEEPAEPSHIQEEPLEPTPLQPPAHEAEDDHIPSTSEA